MTDHPVSDPVRDLVIVGGGTAGWMVAAAAARFLGDGHRRIRLVESDAIGTVGVGESTIPTITQFNGMLGIREADFVRATGATFKLGIEFSGWGAEGERYFHSFGQLGRAVDGVSLHQFWLKYRDRADTGRLEAYSMCAAAAAAGRFAHPTPDPRSPLNGLGYAYHVDAGLYAAMLRRYAEAGGVSRLEGRVVQVIRSPDDGTVTAVRLDDGREVAGDLFVDCSGFRSLLLGDALAVPWRDWSHWLPCDRAIAVPTRSAGAPTPYTRTTARAAGWQWRIPLQHRVGNGHVYASAHMTDDEAERVLLANLDAEPIGDLNPLKFRAGHRTRMWEGNVVAIGLSAGFLEPLEATSIHLIQYGIQRLFELFPGRRVAEVERREYNRLMGEAFATIRDFIVLHYKATRRTGGFWDQVREMPVPDSLATKMALFADKGRVFRTHDDIFELSNWAQVMVGQGVMPQGYDPLVDSIAGPRALAAMAELRGAYARAAVMLPDHAAAIDQAMRPPVRGRAVR